MGQSRAAGAPGEQSSCFTLGTFLLPFYGRGWRGTPIQDTLALLGGCPSRISCWPGVPTCRELERWSQARGGEASAAEAAPGWQSPTLQGLGRAAGISWTRAHLGSMGLLLPKREGPHLPPAPGVLGASAVSCFWTGPRPISMKPDTPVASRTPAQTWTSLSGAAAHSCPAARICPGTQCCRCCSVAKSCPTLCEPVDCSTPSFPVLHHLLELAQTHVH